MAGLTLTPTKVAEPQARSADAPPAERRPPTRGEEARLRGDALRKFNLDNPLTSAYVEQRAAAGGLLADAADTASGRVTALHLQLSDVREPRHPDRLPGFAEAQDCLREAVPETGPTRVHIHADGDADGLTAGLLMREAVLARNPHATVSVGVAPRTRETTRWLDADTDLPADLDLLIVADQRPRDLPAGLRTLSVDHHADPGASLPGETVFNPRTEGPRAPGTEMSAAGLAWHLAVGEGADGPDLAPLAAIGLIGDRATMTGDVRALVRMAIDHVRSTHYSKLDPRLRGLVSETNAVSYKRFSADSCAFYLAPKLNAALRRNSDSPRRWLVADDWVMASEAAADMTELQAQQRDLIDQADAQLRVQLGEPGRDDGAPLVRVVEFRGLDGYHGLVASRVAERYQCLAIIGDGTRYSARRPDSLSDINLAEWLQLPLLRDNLGARGGGHAGAAGFMLSIPHTAAHLSEVLGLLARVQGVRRRDPEAVPARLSDLTPEAVAQLEALGPFGEGWPKPQFEIDLLLDRDGTSILGNTDRHVMYGVRDPDGGPAWRALHFNVKEPGAAIPLVDQLQEGPVPVRAICELDGNERRLIIRSWDPRPSTAGRLAANPVLAGLG